MSRRHAIARSRTRLDEVREELGAHLDEPMGLPARRSAPGRRDATAVSRPVVFVFDLASPAAAPPALLGGTDHARLTAARPVARPAGYRPGSAPRLELACRTAVRTTHELLEKWNTALVIPHSLG